MFTNVYEPLLSTLQLRHAVFLSCLCNLYTNQYENLKSCLFKKQFLLTLNWTLCFTDRMYRVCVCVRAHALSYFSCVRLFATLWTVAHQIPLSMGFSRQGWWSGLLFPPSVDLPDPGIEPMAPELQAVSLPLSPWEAPDVLCLSIKFSLYTAPHFLSLTSSLTLHNTEW